MTQPSLLLPFKISFSVAEEHEYTAHEMWVKAEISGRSHSSYLLAIQSFNDTFEERTRNSRFESDPCWSRALMADLKRTVQIYR